MLKLTLGRKFPFLRLTDAEARGKLEALFQENERLRARLVEAQHAKGEAFKQADTLRKEKERLRLRATSLKQDLDLIRKTNEQLHEKIAALKEINEQLSKRTDQSL